MFDIKEELKILPQKPGVYLMKDVDGQIIYVGKAIILKNRVRQYFQNAANHTNKIRTMVEQVNSFEYIVTDSELEALILECNLIKKHQPKYNTMLKDDKTYPYIKVSVAEMFPRVSTVREIQKDKAKYYGPYTSALAAKEIVEFIRKTWKIRTCNRVLPRDKGKERPCLYFHIHECEAPCQGYITEAEYRKQVDSLIGFLNGNYDPVIKMLQNSMEEASENLEFEKAAEFRDQLNNIQIISQKQKIVNTSMEDQDIIAFAASTDEALIQVFFVRNGQMIGRDHFRLDNIEGLTRSEIMTNFIKQFYLDSPFIPRELILQEEVEDADVISQWLSNKRGHKVYLKVPQKGEKNRLVEMAAKNAEITFNKFNQAEKQKVSKTQGAQKELLQILQLDMEIERIEAYDISNISGQDAVGSMIVFENGVSKRSEYRKFKIKEVKQANDYASLEEVLTRRFVRALEEQKEMLEKGLAFGSGKFAKLPGLILMDGGKGQVGIANKVLDAVGLEIPVCGMVKDDRHNTRGLYYHNQEMAISKRSEAFKLITRIQDEAHRFAIEYHRKLRAKRQVHSALDDIEGIGPKRRLALLRHFGSLEKLKQASLEELKEVPSMNEKAARSIINFWEQQQAEES